VSITVHRGLVRILRQGESLRKTRNFTSISSDLKSLGANQRGQDWVRTLCWVSPGQIALFVVCRGRIVDSRFSLRAGRQRWDDGQFALGRHRFTVGAVVGKVDSPTELHAFAAAALQRTIKPVRDGGRSRVGSWPLVPRLLVTLRRVGCIDLREFNCSVKCIGELTDADQANSLRSWGPNARSSSRNPLKFVQLQQVGDDRVRVGLGQSIRLSPRCSQKALRMIGCTVLLATPAVYMHPSWVALPNQGTFAPVAGSPTH
jgi:hypothetical protein